MALNNNIYDKSDYTQDQWQEIEEGILAGLDVSVYAKKEFFAIQMLQIRLGLKEGIDVSKYASTDYDWFQMEEIRNGLNSNVDISKYADPSVPFDVMRQIREGLEQGIDLSAGKSFQAGVLRQLRIALSQKIDIRRYIREGYEEEQLKQIRIALEKGVDIDKYINTSQRGAVIREIVLGLEKNLDVDIYLKEFMSWQQMREIRIGLEERLDVSCYENPLYSWQQMKQIRLGLEDNLPVEDYASLMYTAREMDKRRQKLLEAAAKVGTSKQNDKVEYRDFMLLISASHMEAYIIVTEIGTKISTKTILTALEEEKVMYGIDYDALEALETKGAATDMITIARGVESQTGKDGWYEYMFTPDIKAKPKLLENGAVDYKNIKWFEVVRKGQTLAVYHPAEFGKVGRKVTGETIPGIKGNELSPLAGSGFKVLADNVTYVSDVDGKVELKNGRLEVTGLLVLENVNKSMGNVIFNGSVYVKGMIGDGSVIKADKDILVDGFTEGAILDSGGDIILKEGNNAGGRGYIKAANDVMGNFFENARIIAGKNMRANYCLNSDVYADKTIEITGNKGILAGGSVHAGESISSQNIGNEAGVMTKIKVGKSEKYQKDKALLDSKENDIKRELVLLRNAIKDIQRKYSPEQRNNNPLYIKIENAIYTKENELKDIYMAKDKLDEEFSKSKYAKVIVKGNVYLGVSVNVNGALWRAKKSSGITIKNKDDKIAIYRNGGHYEG